MQKSVSRNLSKGLGCDFGLDVTI